AVRRPGDLAALRGRLDRGLEIPVRETRHDEAARTELTRELELVVVDMLTVAVQAGNHDGGDAELERGHDRPDAGVGDHDACRRHEADDLVVPDPLEPLVPEGVRTGRRMPVLDDDLLRRGERRHEVEHPSERVLVGPERHEDQKIAPSYFALRKCRCIPGHWTKKLWATGWTSRPVSEGSEMRVKLSM